jgi:hypothetical protein
MSFLDSLMLSCQRLARGARWEILCLARTFKVCDALRAVFGFTRQLGKAGCRPRLSRTPLEARQRSLVSGGIVAAWQCHDFLLDQAACRFIRLATVCGAHVPPRAVGMPRAFKASAMSRNVVRPARWI